MPTELETIEEDKELIISDRIDLLLNKVEILEKKINKLHSVMEKNDANCEKMSNHIDFIETVYSGLKSPLEYIRYKLGFSDSTHLPVPHQEYSKIEN
tara:strand:- start:1343 stop:1633 length:291 start_codon:yes stop_codon:yes gene_type:complete